MAYKTKVQYDKKDKEHEGMISGVLFVLLCIGLFFVLQAQGMSLGNIALVGIWILIALVTIRGVK